jgi:spore maturation protein CgeB
MRIFQVIEATSNPSVVGSQTWYRNLHEPLTEMGHEVVLFPSTEGRLASWRKDHHLRSSFSRKMLDRYRVESKRKPFDLFFSYLMDGMVEPSIIDEIRKSGVPTCNFSCNNAHQFENVHELSPHFDYNLHSEKDVGPKFLSIGATPIWWPMASNPKYFKPIDLPRSISVSFVGANYSVRARYVAHLLEGGVDVHTYGPGWVSGASNRSRSLAKRYKYLMLASLPFSRQFQTSASSNLADHDFRRFLATRFPANVHPAVSDDDLIALYSKTQVSLGFLEVHEKHDPARPVVQHLHLREFEAPMSGALYCTGYSHELAEMFEPDKEVVVYRNQFELLEKVEYFLRNPNQAEGIRKAGRARALAHHTYHHRFKTLFDLLGLH